MTDNRVNEILQQGMAFHSNRHLVEAEACYKEALSIDPGNADAIHLLGLLADSIGDKGLAVDLISKAIAIDPSNANFLVSLARILKSEGKTELALAYFLESVKLAPMRPDVCLDLANLYNDLGKIEESRLFYRKYRELKPEDMASSAQGAAARSMAPFSTHIAEQLQHGLKLHLDGRLQDARACYATAFSVDSSNTLAADLLELAADALEDLALVEEIPQATLPIFSGMPNGMDSSASQIQIAELKLQLIEKRNENLWISERLNVSKAQLDAVIKSGAKWNFAPALQSAKSNKEAGNLMEALGIAELILYLQNNNKEAAVFLVELGVIFHQRRDLATAERIYNKLIEYNPTNVDALHLLGLIYSQRHQYQRALELIERSLESKTGVSPHFFKNAGQVADKLPDPAKAEAYFRKAISLNKTYAEAYSCLAQLLIKQQRFEEAERCLTDAIELIPDSKEIADQLHYLNYKAKPLSGKAN